MQNKVFLIGICGSGMSALAAMFKEQGWDVSGSDTGFYPPSSDLLKRHKIKFLEGWNPKNIKSNYDLVIIGNVCRKNNPEVIKTLELKLKYSSFPDAIRNHFIKEREAVVITGTHGKTTTTTLISWILQIASEKSKKHEKPSFMVGGIPLNFNNNFQLADSKYYVIEGDEYDSAYFQKNPKFLHYKPRHVIITSIEFDHFDIYPDMKSYIDAYRALLDDLPKGYTLLLNYDSEELRKLGEEYKSLKSHWYSIENSECEWSVKNIKLSFEASEFDVYYKNKLYDNFTSSLIGSFNVSNMLAAISMAHALGIDKRDTREAIKLFKGIKRRQECIGILNGAKVIEDFAHHPTAVKEILRAYSKVEDKNKLWAIFEPRSATARRKIFQDELCEALSIADKVIVPDPINRGDISKEDLFDALKVTKDLQKKGVDSQNITVVDEIVDYVKINAEKNDIIVIMSNGGFGGIYKKIFE